MAECNKYEEILIQQACESKSTLQPRLCLVGEISNPTCFVYVCNQLFAFENPFTAFEFYFNSFFALNLKYPEESQYVWTFFQKAIFGIKTQVDVTNPQLEIPISNVESHP